MADETRGVIFILFLCMSNHFQVVFPNVRPEYERNARLHAYPVIPTKGSPWPMPQSMVTTNIQLDVDPINFLFKSTNTESCDDLEAAFIRYKDITFGREGTALKFVPDMLSKLRTNSNTVVNELKVIVMSECVKAFPTLESDESYKLVVDNLGVATLSATEVWGALRGLETFSQLVYRKADGGFAINQTNISDYPRFKHRGLLLDTSRHFLSMKVLKANLDVMAQNKLNVFHWHIVDDQSFPYQSKAFPDMSIKGAYSPFRHVYGQDDIRGLIEYARQRGIRVIPEFDSPGHTESWGKAITYLLTKCYTDGKPNGQFGPVNPVYNTTFTFLSKFFTEIASVFPDKYVHLGGDEVSFSCWESNPDVTVFMKEMEYGKDYSKLEQYYMQKLLDIVNGLNKSYIIWQEVIDNNAKVAQDTVVTVWKGGYQKELDRVTSLGYKVLLSSPWYVNYISYGVDWPQYYEVEPLDFNEPSVADLLYIHLRERVNAFSHTAILQQTTLNIFCLNMVADDTVVEVWKSGYQAELAKVTKLGYKTLLSSCWYLDLISYGTQWTNYYACDPHQFNGTESQKKLVMGGEACLWGEYVDDTNLLSRLWPRSSAVAERLWSSSTVNDAKAAAPRIEEMRCRLVRRGYPAEPPNGPSFCNEEYVENV